MQLAPNAFCKVVGIRKGIWRKGHRKMTQYSVVSCQTIQPMPVSNIIYKMVGINDMLYAVYIDNYIKYKNIRTECNKRKSL